ncbi:alpha/beta hydrolase [Sulfitobacter sp. D35]|uniref:alpha/beta hydrolase n=1 Tax=Sulfitobacter sp. D35 TaxID=3083252 RepID=UPI00296F1DCD|nr:alpha/beta hydrolase [Sulfitobacter sp. D35]MDW4498297.1 alpha/beta hydrolase [Sulfitobacter sp. D35]
MTWLTAVLIAALAVTALPWILELRRRPMDDAARQSAPGQFADLPQGRTHYHWTGPTNGPVAVCVHGLTTPGYVWRDVADGLAAMGYRVLVYDHIGRGFSDRARQVQDRAFFIDHLDALLAHEGVDQPVTLLGYSMGGAVATVYAARHPARVRALILLAPAGMGRVAVGVNGMLLNTPLLGDWLMLTTYPKQFREGIEAERASGHDATDVNDRQLAELETRGFVPAVLASLRGLMSEVLEQDHRAILRAGIPVLAIWGREDEVIPLAAADVLTTWNPDVRTVIVDGAGHGLPYTHGQDVIEDIAGFLDTRT